MEPELPPANTVSRQVEQVTDHECREPELRARIFSYLHITEARDVDYSGSVLTESYIEI
jgi:hypothetical protein